MVRVLAGRVFVSAGPFGLRSFRGFNRRPLAGGLLGGFGCFGGLDGPVCLFDNGLLVLGAQNTTPKSRLKAKGTPTTTFTQRMSWRSLPGHFQL